MPTVKEEILKFSNHYNTRLIKHSNPLVRRLLGVSKQSRLPEETEKALYITSTQQIQLAKKTLVY